MLARPRAVASWVSICRCATGRWPARRGAWARAKTYTPVCVVRCAFGLDIARSRQEGGRRSVGSFALHPRVSEQSRNSERVLPWLVPEPFLSLLHAGRGAQERLLARCASKPIHRQPIEGVRNSGEGAHVDRGFFVGRLAFRAEMPPSVVDGARALARIILRLLPLRWRAHSGIVVQSKPPARF